MTRISAWLRAHPTIADALLPLGILFLLNLSGNTGSLSTPGLLMAAQWSWTAEMACIALLGLPAVFRRSHPKAAALTFVGLAFAQIVLGPVMTIGDLFALVMLYSALVYGSPNDTALYSALAFAMGLLDGIAITLSTNAGSLVDTLRDGTGAGMPQHAPQCATLYRTGPTGSCARLIARDGIMTTTMIWLVLGSVIVIALWTRARRATIMAMQERNAALEASEAEERRIAASAERARIARDMHDVVAHTLSIIIVQSDGGRYAGANDPAVARSTMETIRHESERALNDMQRLLSVFGGPAHAGYADLDALVAAADAALETASGGSVVRRVAGQARPADLGDQAGVAVYRLVQEALTNARKYAGPGVHVTVDERWDANGLAITVRDDGRGAAAALDGHKPGYGLIGMQERIVAAGGTVSAGPRIGGGYEVSAQVPYAAHGGGAPAASAVPATSASLAASVASAAHGGRAPADGEAPHGPSSLRAAAATSALPNAAAAAEPAAAPALPRAAHAPVIPVAFTARVQDALAALRSKPINAERDAEHDADAAHATVRRANVIERLARWTERHYLAMDVTVSLLLCAFLIRTSFMGYSISGDVFVSSQDAALITMSATLPLAFRRRFPEASAAASALLAALQLVFLPPVMYVNALALVSLYSAVTYGSSTAWRWLGPAAAADSLLAGAKLLASFDGHATLASMVAGSPVASYTGTSMLAGAVFYGLMIAVLCAGSIALGLWTRSRGSNALVLQMREEALRAEQAKQKVLAANMERDRIGAAIQSEVTATLTGVIDRANAGLAMLDAADASGVAPSPESISRAFETIGRQGRTALAHMRQLLAVLRETGSTDDAHRGGGPAMQLAPAAPLSDQLARAQHGTGMSTSANAVANARGTAAAAERRLQ